MMAQKKQEKERKGKADLVNLFTKKMDSKLGKNWDGVMASKKTRKNGWCVY